MTARESSEYGPWVAAALQVRPTNSHLGGTMEYRFAYGPSKRSAIGVIVIGLLFMVAAFFMSRGGYQIGRFGSFLSPGASAVVWGLAGAGGAALAVAGVLMARAGVGEVVVNPMVISAPRSELSREIVHINPATIRDFRVNASQYGESTTVVYDGGKLKLIRGHFADPAGYQHCLAAIRQTVGAAQQAPGQPQWGPAR